MKDRCTSHEHHHGDGGDVLGAAGLKRTPLRLAIVEFFSGKTKPWSQKELIDSLSLSTREEIDRVSVYRNIHQFLDAGIIHEVANNSYVSCQHLSEGASPVHVLLYCLKCARHEEVCEASERDFFQQLMGRSGFFSKRGGLQVSGVCRSCIV